MGTHLQQLLRSLCSNTEWNYSVFWKLRHRSRMVLTCEDAYCGNHGKNGHFDSNCSETLGSLCDGHHPYDAIGLAVAKMSCYVYSLGEGIIGQVAVTRKHQWIFADEEHAVNSLSSSKNCDGWQAQFLAGIQTIAVAAVVPHGVVLLGSLSKVSEDLKLLSHIRDLFSSLQDSAATHVSNSMQQSLQSFQHMPDVPLSPATLQGCLRDPTKDEIRENPHLPLQKQGASFISEDVETAKLVQSVYQKGESKLVKCQNSYDALTWCNAEESEPASVSEIADGMEQSMLTSDTGTAHLIEAAVSNLCRKDRTFKPVKSFSSSADSLLTTDKMPEPSSESCSMRTSNGFSSSPVLCKGKSLRPVDPAKGNKKRARKAENCRHQPRDRQLIEDRIKELRKLVPNGSKCSIDSLLERTIKHTLFLQSISKHADKLSNCVRSRVNKEGCPSYKQGRSWAVEVAGDMNICPIVVENLNRNGQLLIEMLCQHCDHFLEIAEAIRGLGLTILKCTTEGQGDKTWICFVVEGQNSRNMHRMDVLLSLVQILQAETAT